MMLNCVPLCIFWHQKTNVWWYFKNQMEHINFFCAVCQCGCSVIASQRTLVSGTVLISLHQSLKSHPVNVAIVFRQEESDVLEDHMKPSAVLSNWRLHETRVTVFIIRRIIMCVQGVSCVVRGWDKKRNKPVWSGKGSSQIKRLKAPFAYEYLMPIWAERRWSSARSSRCQRKSTLSASGHFSRVSYMNGPPPHSYCKKEFCSSCLHQMRIFFLF